MFKRIDTLIILLIAAGIILRFHQLPSRQYWMIDEERDAFIVKKILVDKHPTLIGGALPGGFYLAPGYFYISASLYFFSKLNPQTLGYVAATSGILTIPLLFYITRRMFNRKTAFLAAFFYTFSYLTIIYNRTWWPLTFSPLITLATYYCLWRIVSQFQKSQKITLIWTLLLAIAIIIGLQSDPSSLSLLVLTILIWFVFHLPIKIKQVIIPTALVIFSHIPLVIFDLRHDFLNAKALLKFLTGGTGAGLNFDINTHFQTLLLIPRSMSRFIWVFGQKDVASQIVPADFYIDAKFAAIPLAFLILMTVVLLLFLKKVASSKRQPAQLIIGAHLIVAALGIALQNSLFGNWNYEWVIQILFPAYAIILAQFVASFRHQVYKFFLPLLILYAVLSIVTVLKSPNSYNLADKMKITQFIIASVGTSSFSLDSIGQNFALGGYRYLFYLHGKEPVKSYMDPLYAGWLYPKENLWQRHPELVAVIVNREICSNLNCPQSLEFEKKYQSYLQKTIKKTKIGHIEALIVDNSDDWVNW